MVLISSSSSNNPAFVPHQLSRWMSRHNRHHPSSSSDEVHSNVTRTKANASASSSAVGVTKVSGESLAVIEIASKQQVVVSPDSWNNGNKEAASATLHHMDNTPNTTTTAFQNSELPREEITGPILSDETPKTSTLHSYLDPKSNKTYCGLDISLSKFKSWLNYTLQPSSSSLKVRTTKVNKQERDLRMKLRTLWFDGCLISEGTEILALYPSEQQTPQASVPTTKEEQRKSGLSSSGKDAKKRGGFSDLLSTYGHRLAAMLQDELEDDTPSPLINALPSKGKMWWMSPSSSQEKKVSNDCTTNDLTAWLQKEYGEDNAHQLRVDLFLKKSEQEQLETLQTFLDWFRSNFPYYYDQCTTCGASAKRDAELQQQQQSELMKKEEEKHETTNNNKEKADHDDEEDDSGTFLGYVYPTTQELQGRASRTEIYQCHVCKSFTRFPRYNKALTVVQHKRGRCGEYSMLLYRLLRVCGHSVRWVIDWADHVWCEVWVGGSGEKEEGGGGCGRWVHLDPCEAAVDNPLLYESWGKKQTYIIAFHAPQRRGYLNQDGKEAIMQDASKLAFVTSENIVNSHITPVTECNGEERNQQQHNPKYASSIVEHQQLPQLIEDVTLTYTSDSIENIHKRREESDELVKLSIDRVEEELWNALQDLQPLK